MAAGPRESSQPTPSPVAMGGAGVASGLTPIPVVAYGKYTLLAKLGHGGMAEVFLAAHVGPAGFRKLVVIKRLHPQLEEEPGVVEMFMDEARLAARVAHPACVQTYEVGEHEGSHFIAMEYLEGISLDRLLARANRRGATPNHRLAAWIAAGTLEGLHSAHELRDYDGTPLGVIHRDVSPHNVFVTYAGAVKLLDFGIAKASTQVAETRTGHVKGKYAYIAPEQATAAEIDRRADVWSMGVVLWEMLTGHRLFKSVNELATLHSALTATIQPPSSKNPAVPKALDAIVMRALEREPKARWETAAQMQQALQEWMAAQTPPVARSELLDHLEALFAQDREQQVALVQICMRGIDDRPVPVLPSGVSPATISGGHGRVTLPEPTPSGVRPAEVVPATPPERTQSRFSSLLLVALGIATGVSIAILAMQPPAPTTTTTENVPAPVPGLSPTNRPETEPETETETETEAEAEAEAEAETEPETVSEPPTKRVVTEYGYVTLDTVPWTEVSWDGRSLGSTPLVHTRFPAGTHVLRLRNAQRGIDRRYSITVQPGQTIRRRVAL